MGIKISCWRISIHPPHAGWDSKKLMLTGNPTLFQSTHPTRGGTTIARITRLRHLHFNPPTPRGVGPSSLTSSTLETNFNPPTPRGVGHLNQTIFGLREHFNPPTPRGVGQDHQHNATHNQQHFNPPTPRGVGQENTAAYQALGPFQSTHPTRGGTGRLL